MSEDCHRRITEKPQEFYADVFPAELIFIAGRRNEFRTLRRADDKGNAKAEDSPKDPPDPIDRYPEQPLQPRCERGLVALALSGGGIRSATFSLGFLQGLASIRHSPPGANVVNSNQPDMPYEQATQDQGDSRTPIIERAVLPMFDYLSTVSGGGYIGSWLVTWMHYSGFSAVHAKLEGYALGTRTSRAKALSSNQGPQQTIDDPHIPIGDADETPEPKQIKHLRNYSNYFTPTLGFFSADTWSAVAAYARNAFLNQLIIVPFVAAALLIPRIAATALSARPDTFGVGIGSALALMVGLALTFANVGAAGKWGHVSWQPLWLKSISGLLFFAGIFLFLLPGIPSPGHQSMTILTVLWRHPGWIIGMILLNLSSLAFYRMEPQSAAQRKEHRVPGWVLWVVAAVVSGVVGGSLLALLVERLVPFYWHQENDVESWHIITWAPGLAVLIFVAAFHLQLGIRGRYEMDLKREWWATFAGWLLIYTALWTILAAISIYGPLLFTLLQDWTVTKISLVTGWLLTTLGGLIAGRSAKTGDPHKTHLMDYVAKVLAPIAVLGFMIGVAIVLNAIPGLLNDSPSATSPSCAESGSTAHNSISHASTRVDVTIVQGALPSSSCGTIQQYFDRWKYADDHRLSLHVIWFFLLLGTALGLAWAVDVNQFSMHAFYRNRLVRCYLRGAGAPGTLGDPVHGFAEHDDFPLAKLGQPCQGKIGPPYLLINTALNITKPEDLSWQERKAAAFLFSPLYCGSNRTGYRRTERYADRVTLGTALAISGAAFTSNMGYHSSRAVAFFLSLFNVRLGWWVGNPQHTSTWMRQGPPMGFVYLLSELFGRLSTNSKYLYLSDGGHFDNLGLYELIRRRCRYIVCCDAGADPEYGFDDLGMAIRKIRADFGVDIEIDLEMLKPTVGQRFVRWHHAFGTIRYDDVDENSPVGLLVYIKASLTGDEPADVLEYATNHQAFPHESTLDQFFAESQFEAYRRLGEHVGREVFRYAQERL